MAKRGRKRIKRDYNRRVQIGKEFGRSYNSKKLEDILNKNYQGHSTNIQSYEEELDKDIDYLLNVSNKRIEQLRAVKASQRYTESWAVRKMEEKGIISKGGYFNKKGVNTIAEKKELLDNLRTFNTYKTSTTQGLYDVMFTNRKKELVSRLFSSKTERQQNNIVKEISDNDIKMFYKSLNKLKEYLKNDPINSRIYGSEPGEFQYRDKENQIVSVTDTLQGRLFEITHTNGKRNNLSYKKAMKQIIGELEGVFDEINEEYDKTTKAIESATRNIPQPVPMPEQYIFGTGDYT